MTRMLPAGTCISHAISSVRHNIAYAFRISWPWYVIVIPLLVVISLLVPTTADGNLEASIGPILVKNLAGGLVMGIAFASIAVNWHRYILLDEVPDARAILRLDDKTQRYFGNLLLIFLIIIVAATAMGFPLGLFVGLVLGGQLQYLQLLLVIIVIPLVGTLLLRLSVKLPAIALGRTDFSLKDALAATKGNFQPLLLVALFEALLFVGSLIVIMAFGALGHLFSPALGIAFAYVMQFVTNWLISIFSITVLTSLYGFFVEGRDF